MSQDWAVEEIVPGTTSPATDVVKITDALLALKSKFSGASLPTTNLYGGMEVVLTSGARYFRNAANDGWLYAGRVDEYSRGTVAMHATTMDLWAQPKIIDGTGSAVTITAISDAPQAGAVRIVYTPAGTVITHGATFSVQGGASYTTKAGEALVFEAVTTSTYKVSVVRMNSLVAPVARVSRSAVFSVATGVFTKIPFDVTDFDSDGTFTGSPNYRFQPTVPGWYTVTIGARVRHADAYYAAAHIYKNGSTYASGSALGVATTYPSPSTADEVYLNGSTDYVEGYVYHLAGATYDVDNVRMSCSMSRSGS